MKISELKTKPKVKPEVITVHGHGLADKLRQLQEQGATIASLAMGNTNGTWIVTVYRP